MKRDDGQKARKFVQQTALLPQMREAINELHNYTVTLFLGDRRAASGVLINASGCDAILTAYHVAEPLTQSEKFALCIADYPHSLWVASNHVEHVPVGVMNDDPVKQREGPDLSIIVLRDRNLIGTLRSKKSFTFLEAQDLSIFLMPLSHLGWGIAGCPFNHRKVENQGAVIGLHSFAGMAAFLERSVHNGLDYLELRMPCDGKDYPADFSGVSGGGMWAVTFKSITGDDGTARIVAVRPVLAGIAFYQSPEKDGWRLVRGHGFDSIYSRAGDALKKRGRN